MPVAYEKFECTLLLFVCFSQTELNNLVIISIVAFCLCSRRNWTFSTVASLNLVLTLLRTHWMYIIHPWSFNTIRISVLIALSSTCKQRSSLDLALLKCLWLSLRYDTLLKASQVMACINLQSDNSIYLQNTLFPFCQHYIVKIHHAVLFLISLLFHLILSLDL